MGGAFGWLLWMDVFGCYIKRGGVMDRVEK
jgi:hypothetical protein